MRAVVKALASQHLRRARLLQTIKCQLKMKTKAKRLFIRSGLILVALMVIGTGLVPLALKGDLFYSNWWGGLVFAPLAVLGGIFFLYLVLFKYEKIEKMK